MRSHRELLRVQSLVSCGRNDGEIARLTGVPRRTVSDWRRGQNLIRDRTCIEREHRCVEAHDFSALPESEYAYLIGLYLGDGCISEAKRGVYRIRITLDAKYPEIISECQSALNALFPQKRANAGRRRQSNCVDVSMWSKHWLCLIPQHGAGAKHQRPIRLTSWQSKLIAGQRRMLLRRLIHSDGSRIVATERSKTGVRRSPRYSFSNRSEDIKQLFCESCDALGIRWTRPSDTQIAIYRKASVAILDEFVGPKA